jgi:outer membrane protein TolC
MVRKQFQFLMCLFFSSTVGSQVITLEGAIERAMRLDPVLRSSKLNLQAVEENIAISRSRLLPQISLQGSSSQLTQTTTQDISGGVSASRSFTGPSTNHQFVIRQAIHRPKEVSLLKISELQAEYSVYKHKADVADLKMKVVIAWIDLLGAQEVTNAYVKPLSLMEMAVKQERRKFENGESSKDIVADVQAQFENAQATYLQAQENLKAKQRFFQNLIQISETKFVEKNIFMKNFDTYLDIEKFNILQTVKDSSYELKMARTLEKIQSERVRFSSADHKPTIELLASVNLAQNDATSTQGYQYRNKQIGIQYNFPLFNGGGITAAVKQANLAYEASQLDSDAINNKIENEFDVAWAVVLGNAARHKALISSVVAAQELVQSMKRASELGVKSLADQANAEILLSRKMVECIIIAQDYLKAKLKIKKLDYLEIE